MLIHQAYDPNNRQSQAFIARNVGWYRKKFKLPAEWEGSTVWIYFEGIFHETTPWVNGKQVGYHKQGYTPFALRLDNIPGIKFGDEENVLALFVDASTGTGWWYEGGGLNRHQQLIRTPPVHIEQDGAWVFTNNTSSTSSAGGSADFHTSVQVVNDTTETATATTTATVRTTITDMAGKVVATGTSAAVTDLSVPVVVTASASSGKSAQCQVSDARCQC
jgi:beta-galactosidase